MKKKILIIFLTVLVLLLAFIPALSVHATPVTPEGEEESYAWVLFYGAILLIQPFVLLFELIGGFFELIWNIILLIFQFLANSLNMIAEMFKGTFG